MTKTQHLLMNLAEECGEVAKAAIKAARFGLDDEYRGKGKTPRRDLVRELNDVGGVLELLHEAGALTKEDIQPKRKLIEAKKRKLEKMMAYSRVKGTL